MATPPGGREEARLDALAAQNAELRRRLAAAAGGAGGSRAEEELERLRAQVALAAQLRAQNAELQELIELAREKAQRDAAGLESKAAELRASLRAILEEEASGGPRRAAPEGAGRLLRGRGGS